MYIDNNTVSTQETRFLKGVELVNELTKKYEVPNENWAYPYMTFGNPNDPYYGEIWDNGMDYARTFYLLEFQSYSVKSYLLMDIDVDTWSKFRDPREFFNLVFWIRRDKVWLKQNEYGRYRDDVLPFLTYGDKVKDRFNGLLSKISFEHGSQPKIDFLINKELIFNDRKEKLLKLEKSISDVEELSGVKIETQYGKPMGKVIQSPNDPWTCDDCGNSVYSCKC